MASGRAKQLKLYIECFVVGLFAEFFFVVGAFGAPRYGPVGIAAGVTLPVIFALAVQVVVGAPSATRTVGQRYAAALLLLLIAALLVPVSVIPVFWAFYAITPSSVLDAVSAASMSCGCLGLASLIPAALEQARATVAIRATGVVERVESPGPRRIIQVPGVAVSRPVRTVERVVERIVERVVEVPTPSTVWLRETLPVGEPTDVYRLYAADGALLYVGISTDARARLKHHAATKHWWSEVARHDTRRYPYRALALSVEHAAIAYERPRYNKARGALHDSGSTDPVFRNWRGTTERVSFVLPAAPDQDDSSPR